MPRKRSKVPSYCRHKHSGRAVVRIDGRDQYLGEYGSPESHREYERLIAEWRASRVAEVQADGPGDQVVSTSSLSVNETILAYWRFAKTYYMKDGEPTKELSGMREALLPLRLL